MSLKYKIEYGPCYSSGKSGSKVYGRPEYIFGRRYGEAIQGIFDDLGLPIPDKGDVYNGNMQDMLFSKTHGIKIVAGPLIAFDALSAGVVQPIGWKSVMHDGYEDNVAVVIYPGVELLTDVYSKDKEALEQRRVKASNKVALAGNHFGDDRVENFGVIKTFNRLAGIKEDVSILIDVDNLYLNPKAELHRERLGLIKEVSKYSDNKAHIMSFVMSELYGDNSEFASDLAAFNVHQPLRESFWNAKSSAGFDKQALSDLYDECYEIKNSPKEMQFNDWEMKNGVLVKKELRAVEVSLHSPWAKKRGAKPEA